MKPTLSLALLSLAALPAPAADWPGFRGSDGTGISSEKNLPLKWSATDGVKWRIDLPERGNSSPIVWGDRVFLTQALDGGNRRTLLCLDRATGRQLWQAGVDYPEREPSHRDNPYCSATPVTDGERVIASFGSAGLVCYDFAGKEVWRRDLGKMSHVFGNAASPVLAGDLCVVNFGPDEKARIVAVNKRTGEIAWEVAAPKSEGGDLPPRGPGGGERRGFGEPGDAARRGPGVAIGGVVGSAAISPGQFAAPHILAQADQDSDAKLSKSEFIGLAQAWFDKLDKDKAGALERRVFSERFAELLPPPQNSAPPGGGDRPDQNRPGRGIGFAFVSIADSDRDGTLKRDEWIATFAKWFVEWDADHAGALDEAKLRTGLNAALPRPQFGVGLGGPGGGGFGGGFGRDRGPGGGFGGGGGRGPAGSWSTPVLIKAGDREELIVHFPSKIAALDPKTGKELWSAKGLGGASYTTPVVGEGAIVYTSSGPGGGAAAALKPGGSGDVTESQNLWRLDRFQSAVGTGVITGGHLYTISQAGVAMCNDLKTGVTVWQERLQGGSARGGSWSSVLLADGKLYIPNQGGDVFVLRAAPKFEVLATNSVGEPTNATLAASDGALFLRTDKSLWCFAEPARK